MYIIQAAKQEHRTLHEVERTINERKDVLFTNRE